jgi:hypothetical protein
MMENSDLDVINYSKMDVNPHRRSAKSIDQ